MQEKIKKQETPEEVGFYHQKLFNYLSDLGVTALESEMLEIEEIVLEMHKVQQMYSKEEVLEHLNYLIMMPSSKLDKFTDDDEMVTMKWFEQFKNK